MYFMVILMKETPNKLLVIEIYKNNNDLYIVNKWLITIL